MSCEYCTTFVVLFYQSRITEDGKIVLWDGKNTYWTEEMIGSGYKHIDSSYDETSESVFEFIGYL